MKTLSTALLLALGLSGCSAPSATTGSGESDATAALTTPGAPAVVVQLFVTTVAGVHWNDFCATQTEEPGADLVVEINGHRLSTDQSGNLSFNASAGSTYGISIPGFTSINDSYEGATAVLAPITPTVDDGNFHQLYAFTGDPCPAQACSTISQALGDQVCGPRASCVSGSCVPGSCNDDVDCPGDEVCKSGSCE